MEAHARREPLDRAQPDPHGHLHPNLEVLASENIHLEKQPEIDEVVAALIIPVIRIPRGDQIAMRDLEVPHHQEGEVVVDFEGLLQAQERLALPQNFVHFEIPSWKFLSFDIRP